MIVWEGVHKQLTHAIHGYTLPGLLCTNQWGYYTCCCIHITKPLCSLQSSVIFLKFNLYCILQRSREANECTTEWSTWLNAECVVWAIACLGQHEEALLMWYKWKYRDVHGIPCMHKYIAKRARKKKKKRKKEKGPDYLHKLFSMRMPVLEMNDSKAKHEWHYPGCSALWNHKDEEGCPKGRNKNAGTQAYSFPMLHVDYTIVPLMEQLSLSMEVQNCYYCV